MELIQKVLELLLEVTVFVESTPLWWKSLGYTFAQNLVVTFAVYTLRLAIEVSLIRLIGYGLGEAVIVAVKRFSPQRYAARLDALQHRPKSVWFEKLVTFLKRLGYFGLFLAGWIPIPVAGMSGPIIYNLERLHKHWYRFDNLAFACLLGGGLMKMALVEGALYHQDVTNIWNQLISLIN